MMNEFAILVVVFYLASAWFVIWAVVSAVGALKRIAAALEAQVDKNTPDTPWSRSSKRDDPAYKYIPK